MEKKDEEYLRLYSEYAFFGKDPDVKIEDMKKSKSKAKFACYACHRLSFRMNKHNYLEILDEDAEIVKN